MAAFQEAKELDTVGSFGPQGLWVAEMALSMGRGRLSFAPPDSRGWQRTGVCLLLLP